jgi:hypothetical protein
MNTKHWIAFLSMLLIAVGLVACSRARSDIEITSDVQTRIHADAALAAAPITVQSNSGVVVLSGSVETDVARSSAENAAKQVEGVKGVINNLQVMTAGVTPPLGQPTLAAQSGGDRQVPKPKPSVAKTTRPVKAAPVGSALPESQRTQAASPQPTQPAPTWITIPEGTGVTIRLIDPVDTEKNKEGDTFRASLDSPIVIQDKTVIPKNADVEARLVSAKSAGHFTGSSAVVLVVTKITVGRKTYDVQTGEFTKQGASRGKRSAATIGGGAAAGAVIGAIAGGGKGAAIGAAAGAGAGTGIQALTKGQQIKLPSETVLEFQLKAPLTVTPVGETVKAETVG